MKNHILTVDELVEKINKAELALLNRKDKNIKKHIKDYFKYKQQLAELLTESD